MTRSKSTTMSEESCTKSVLSPGTAMGSRNIQKAQPMSGFNVRGLSRHLARTSRLAKPCTNWLPAVEVGERDQAQGGDVMPVHHLRGDERCALS